MLIDGDVPRDHPRYMPKDKTLHHCYVGGNQPFWVQGKSWVAAEELDRYQVLELANGQQAEACLIWPVIRGIQPGFGRVCSNMSAEGQEVHIVDFRNGSNLWKYKWNKHDGAPVPYQAGIPDEELGKIHHLEDEDPFLKAKAYNIEVEEFRSLFIGELGVWVAA